MAHFDTAPSAAAPTFGLAAFVRRTFGTLTAWNESRVTRISLSRLTDRELDDIGLTRRDIDRF